MILGAASNRAHKTKGKMQKSKKQLIETWVDDEKHAWLEKEAQSMRLTVTDLLGFIVEAFYSEPLVTNRVKA